MTCTPRNPSLTALVARAAPHTPAALLTCALVFAPACGTTTDLCAQNPPNADCEQCRTLPRAKECPQCLGASPDPDCEGASGAGGHGADAGGSGSVLPLVDGSDSGPDANVHDAAPDSSPPACGGSPGPAGEGGCPDTGTDAGPCPQGCSGTTPLCLRATDACVECRTHADCDGTKSLCDPATHECVECLQHSDCGSSQPRCDPAAHACVECLAHADCDDATAAKCATATHTCVPCTASSQCAHVAGKTVCDLTDGECVECTQEAEDECAGKVCDLDARSCTAIDRASKLVCQACAWDSECPTGDLGLNQRQYRCVPMDFDGSFHGSYCLKIFSTGCGQPYTVTVQDVESRSGATADDYCGVDQTATTCEAVRDLVEGTACPSGMDSECGAVGLDDGLCKTVGGVPNQCTYTCDSALRCGATFMCNPPTTSWCH